MMRKVSMVRKRAAGEGPFSNNSEYMQLTIMCERSRARGLVRSASQLDRQGGRGGERAKVSEDRHLREGMAESVG